MSTTQNVTPAYMIEYRSNLYGTKRKFFQHDSLLMARKGAIAHAEAQLDPDDLFDDEYPVNVYLVERDLEVDADPTIITCVFQNFIAVDGDYEEIKHRGLNPEQEQTMKEYYKRVLIALQRELEYFQAKKIPVGMGAYDVAIRLEHKPYPINHISFLFDAMSYAMAAISLHNMTNGVSFAIVYAMPDDPIRVTPIPDK